MCGLHWTLLPEMPIVILRRVFMSVRFHQRRRDQITRESVMSKISLRATRESCLTSRIQSTFRSCSQHARLLSTVGLVLGGFSSVELPSASAQQMAKKIPPAHSEKITEGVSSGSASRCPITGVMQSLTAVKMPAMPAE